MDGTLLRFHRGRDGSTQVLWVSGELDIASAPELERAVTEAVDGRGADVRLDLRDLTFMDASGARALLHAHKTVDSLHRRLVLVSPTHPVHTVLELLGLYEVLAVEDQDDR